ncbi:hypothetical protein CPB84DRAFT_1846818 [Gymnopilus junonius]|uniref:Uncharacterized protein n=1 Tax=Gymnopilus junonius TaxID=109634 RepID=A0A9P5NQS0_GYMJU|nr:hypothetical protein CPB84DRAFT_1846818 [Gymnopilus junonius]
MSDIATIDSPEIPSQAYNVSSNIIMKIYYALSSTCVNVGGPQWEAAIAGIAYSWKMCQLTSTGLIACVLAVLQIQPIFASTTTRTFVMASIMFSCSSLVSSCLYIASKESFLKRRVRNKWKAALDATDEFWTLVAFRSLSLCGPPAFSLALYSS